VSTPHRTSARRSDGSALGIPGPRRHRTKDRDEAQQIVSEIYMPHRLWLKAGSSLSLDLVAALFGEITAGLVTYGTPARVSTEDTPEFLLTVTLRGHAVSRSGTDDALSTTSGQAVVFRVDEPLNILGSTDCLQLALKAPRAMVEGRLERLLDRGISQPVRFEPSLRTETLRLAQPSLQLVVDELKSPSGWATRPTIARHLEGLLIDAMLLAQPHNYQEALLRETRPGPKGAVARAAELIHDRPGPSMDRGQPGP
jgi:hypothetical protein